MNVGSQTLQTEAKIVKPSGDEVCLLSSKLTDFEQIANQ